MDAYLKETYFLDYSAPAIQTLVAEFTALPIHEKIEGWFLKVRDGWRYTPFTIYATKDKYRASFVAANSQGHCIDKSTLFVAGLRALGIPARIRVAKVMNHIAAEGLLKKLGSQYIAPHGIAEAYVNGTWYKASNAFNKTLCDRYQVDPLRFNGTQDAIFQPFNRNEEKYMEYVEDYGHFEDLPFDFIVDTFKRNYPNLSLAVDEQERFII